MIHLDLCPFVHGTSWTQCYSSGITAHSLPFSVIVNPQILGSSFLSPESLISSDLHNQNQLEIDIGYIFAFMCLPLQNF